MYLTIQCFSLHIHFLCIVSPPCPLFLSPCTHTPRAYAPSLPNSFVQSAFFVRSSPLTVGLLLLIALTKSRTRSGGSSSSSPSRSVQDFSTACGSPGEQGVHFVTLSTWT